MVSSPTERHDVLLGMEAGADDYLTKPVDPFDLEARLAAAGRVTALHAELIRYRSELKSMNADLQEVAHTDPLTRLGNRLALAEHLSLDPPSDCRDRGGLTGWDPRKVPPCKG